MPTLTGVARSPLSIFVFSSIAFVLGILMSLQARVNGELGIALDNRVQAALISFTVGLLTLLVLLALVPSMKAGVARIPGLLRERRLLPWHLLGGVAGACFILAQVYSVPLIGVALFTVVGVAAESITALVIDRWGISPGGKHALTGPRIAATVLVIAAVVLAGFDKLDVPTVSVLALAAVFIARVGTTIQVTFNSKVAVIADSYLAATLISFSVGTAFLLVIFLVGTYGGMGPSFVPQPWWLYVGGIIGLVAVAGGAVCIPRIGVLLYGLSGVGGAIAGSLVIDLAIPFANTRVSGLTLLGGVVALAGLITAAKPFARIRSGAQPEPERCIDGLPKP